MADVIEKPIEEVAKETPVEETTEKPVEESTDSPVKETTESPVEEIEKNGSEKVSNKEKKIIQQVEYYFGDFNLNRDKFLLEAVGKDDGWVPIAVLLTFKRLSVLSTDSNIIAEALMKSDNGLVEVSEDKLKIRRHPERPVPEQNEERRKEIMSRTAYVKGFPLETDIDALLQYFADFENVAHVNMRKYLDKPSKTYKFKGSVFVTFEKKEQVEEFLEKKPEYKNNKLICKWQEKYLEEKREEQKTKNNKKKEKKEKEEEKSTFILPKRSVLYFEGADEAVTRELIRDAVEKLQGELEIAFIDFSKGDKTGHFRFTEEDTAAKFLEKLEDKKIKLNDDLSLELRSLDEEEEQAFLAKAVENMKNRRNHFNQKRGGHGHHHHHGRNKRRGGNNDRNDEKKAKSDD